MQVHGIMRAHDRCDLAPSGVEGSETVIEALSQFHVVWYNMPGFCCILQCLELIGYWVAAITVLYPSSTLVWVCICFFLRFCLEKEPLAVSCSFFPVLDHNYISSVLFYHYCQTLSHRDGQFSKSDSISGYTELLGSQEAHCNLCCRQFLVPCPWVRVARVRETQSSVFLMSFSMPVYFNWICRMLITLRFIQCHLYSFINQCLLKFK